LIVIRTLAAAVVAAWLLAAPAQAQVFGQLSPAETLPVNGHAFGAYVNASENALGLLAQLRLSFYPDVDFGFRGGLTRLDLGPTASDRTLLRLGLDVRWLVARASDTFPVDLAVAATLGVERADDFNILSLGPAVQASHLFPMGQGGGVAPYAGLGLAFSDRSILGLDDTDFSVPLRFGAEFRFTPEIRIVGELQLPLGDDYEDGLGFATGVNLPF
jgi:hypothetical protein